MLKLIPPFNIICFVIKFGEYIEFFYNLHLYCEVFWILNYGFKNTKNQFKFYNNSDPNDEWIINFN